MLIFDPDQIACAHGRARKEFSNHSFLIDHIWQSMIDRLHDIKHTFSSPLCLGSRGIQNIFVPLLHGRKFKSPVTQTTFDPITGILQRTPQSADCILSVFDLHTLNNLQTGLLQIRHALQPDGVFLGALPGGETLHELRTALMQAEIELSGGAHPRLHPMIQLPAMAGLMQTAGFALPVIDHERIVVDYKNMTNLLHDLRGMGETNGLHARSRRFAPRNLFTRTEEIYHAKFANQDGALPATFDIIYVIGWGPSDKQQKPLKPGSATVHLSDVLNK